MTNSSPEPVTDDNPDIREIAFDFVGDLGLPEHRSKEWLGVRTERLIQRIVSVVNKYRVAAPVSNSSPEWVGLVELIGAKVEAWLENSKGDAHEQDLVTAIFDAIAPVLAQHIERVKRPDIEQIAIAIGHHFWHCVNDAEARRNGMDAAKDVMKRLEHP